jgi:hypothetical protein
MLEEKARVYFQSQKKGEPKKTIVYNLDHF